MKRTIALIFIFSLVSQHALIYSQTNYQLFITKKNNPKKSFIVNTEKKVSLYYTDSLGVSQKQKGLINIKDVHSFYCDSTLFQLNQINKILATSNRKLNKIIGANVALVGLSSEAMGVIAFILANQNNDSAFTQMIQYIISIFFVSIGIAILFVAAVVASAKTEYFDLENDWDLTIE